MRMLYMYMYVYIHSSAIVFQQSLGFLGIKQIEN